LYDGLFNIVGKASPIPILDMLKTDPSIAGTIKAAAKMYNLRKVGATITDAVIWDVTDWNDPTKFWSGSSSQDDDVFFARYIQMKMGILGKPFCLETIKYGLDLWLPDGYSCTVIEDNDNFRFDINLVVSDENLVAELYTALTIDPEPFGKPSGHSYQIKVTQG
jgi:hypothetical protein